MVKNQRSCYINRKKRHNERYVNFLTEDTFSVLGALGTYGATLVYFYLCAQTPHTYDGEINTGASPTAYELSPQAIQNAFGTHDLDTYRKGIDRLIQLDILHKISGNLYKFDDLPLKYRAKTSKEYDEMKKISATEAFKMSHEHQMQDFAATQQSPYQYDWQGD